MSFDTFELWWQELVRLAALEDWPLGDAEGYRDYFEDGDTPVDTLDNEIENANDDEDDGA